MTGDVGRFFKVAAPPLPMLGGKDMRTVNPISLSNLGLNCTVSAFGVWGCPLIEDSELLNPLLVKANPLARKITFLFGMFDTTNCDFIVRVEVCKEIELLLEKYYPYGENKSRLVALTTGPDVQQFGGIGINALIWMASRLKDEGRLVLPPSRIVV